ncbi:MAG: tetratricopeptide repeat protein [Nitrospiraceae bacterium]|nr:tetratricopeptide repeat protein [Nitrospiraceae bacterium]
MSRTTLTARRPVQVGPAKAFLRLALLALAAVLVLAGCATTATSGDASEAKEAPPDPRVELERDAEQLLKAVRANPQNAELAYKLGNVYFDLENYEQAQSAFETAIAADPNHARAYSNLGLCLRRLGRVDDAIEVYKAALVIDPDDATTWRNFVVALRASGDMPGVVRALKELSALQPDDVQILAQLADTAFKIEYYQDAATAFEKLLRLDPGLSGDYYNLGLCYYCMEDWDKALTTWLTALAHNPRNLSVNKGLAIVYWRRGEYDRAWKAVTQCRILGAHLDPEFIEALQRDSGKMGP